MTGQGSPNELFANLANFRTTWPKRGWSWDNRLSCIASAFGVELADEARAALEVAFPHQWSHRTLAQAPALLQQIAERAGGVRSDQLLVSTPPSGGVVAYGLWWPWGDDTTISLRIGVAGGSALVLEEQLRETFGARLD